MIGKLFSSIALAALITAAPAMAETYAITGGTVWTGTDDAPIADGVVIIIDDEVAGVGDNALAIPSGAIEIDASGSWVTPGIFSAFSRVGIVEVGAEDSTNDTSASESHYSAALNAADGFNPSATSIAVTRIEGVTRMAIMPGFGDSLFAGQGLVADTSGRSGSITKELSFQYISLGETGADRGGGSRPAAWVKFRAALDDAKNISSRYLTNPEGASLNRVDAQALAPAARGQQLILVNAHRASDIRRIIAFSQENTSLNFAIVGATEGWIVADELAAADIPVIIDPFNNLPGSFEQLGSTSRNAERLIAAGVTTAFAPVNDASHQTRLILQSAGNAVANGVSQADAIKAITSIPAEIFGLDTLGRLESGAKADLVIWDGDPLEITSAPSMIFINGDEQSMQSRQTKLRDRYLVLEDETTDLPHAYVKGN